MSKLKWFSGGKDRSERAVKIISLLLDELNDDMESKKLQHILNKYKIELNKKESSVPFILSRMNVDISNCIQKENISLSDSQSDKLKELASLSNIRYGY